MSPSGGLFAISISAWTPSYSGVPTPSGKSVVLIATAIRPSSELDWGEAYRRCACRPARRQSCDPVPLRFASTDTLTAEELHSAGIRSYPRPSVLAAPVEGLDALDIRCWGDLVEHLPHSHRDRRDVRRVADLMVGEEATVAVAVRGTAVKPMRNRRQKRVEARVFDETGPLVAVWFNQPWVARQLGAGAMVLLHGKLRQRNQFWVTEHELMGNGEAPVHTLGLVPVHPTTQGVSPARLRQLVSEARSLMLAVVEPLPARLRIEVELLTGSTSAARRRELLDRLASGQLQLVVGTHALIEDAVEFRDLAVVVVDEQHRFGVRQRAALDAKAPEGLVPHALHMTATPIPRTLSLTAYGDLDATVLRELPRGRQPVETHVVDGARARARAYERIREEIAAGRQCFVVCPLVEESEALQAKAATAEFERLRTTEFVDLKVELIHGQMPSKQKAAAMEAFAEGDADVLVATSVIEVGIDVPNATVMLIEAAERYGLSQLHQLRGRVGRGEHASLCIVFGDPTLPRLEAIARERDGFKLAEVDLELRGAGDVLGTRQHGLPEFRVARLPEDGELLVRAGARADQILVEDPRLEQPEHALLREAVVARFGSELDPIPA